MIGDTTSNKFSPKSRITYHRMDHQHASILLMRHARRHEAQHLVQRHRLEGGFQCLVGRQFRVVLGAVDAHHDEVNEGQNDVNLFGGFGFQVRNGCASIRVQVGMGVGVDMGVSVGIGVGHLQTHSADDVFEAIELGPVNDACDDDELGGECRAKSAGRRVQR